MSEKPSIKVKSKIDNKKVWQDKLTAMADKKEQGTLTTEDLDAKLDIIMDMLINLLTRR